MQTSRSEKEREEVVKGRASTVKQVVTLEPMEDPMLEQKSTLQLTEDYMPEQEAASCEDPVAEQDHSRSCESQKVAHRGAGFLKETMVLRGPVRE